MCYACDTDQDPAIVDSLRGLCDDCLTAATAARADAELKARVEEAAIALHVPEHLLSSGKEG